MGNILEQLQHILAITAFRGSSQSQNELQVEVGEDLLISVGCRMVAFVHDQVVKIRRRELFQVFGNALHRGKNNSLRNIFLASGIFPPV